MYQAHPQFNPPSPEATLWRYMNFTQFVSLMDRQSLHFARVDRLGDRFEGAMTVPEIEAYPSEDVGSADALAFFVAHTLAKVTRHIVFVSCWHENPHKSAAMWKLYSSETDGIAIQTDFRSLAESFLCPDSIHIGKMKYLDYYTDLPDDGTLHSRFLNKRHEFAHEKEVRAICLGDFRKRFEGRSDVTVDEIPVGQYYDVDLDKLIQRIVVAPFAEEWLVDLVSSVATKYDLGDRVTSSILGDDPGWDISW